MRKRVLILHTGGTLGMRPREPSRTLAPNEFGTTVLQHVPELSELADIDTKVVFNIDSSDMNPVHWMALANEVERGVADHDGIVITHGTDCMAYTASALSYVLRNLPCPVVLTGSQRPLADIHTDGRANLIGAVDLATRDIPEVAIYFDEVLFRGNRTTKSSTFAFGAFASPNFPALAEIGTSVRMVTPPLVPQGTFRVEGRFDPRVAVVHLIPGQDAAVLRVLADTDTRALLLVAFGSGNIPVESSGVADAIGALVEGGMLVAIGSQSQTGQVDLGRYMGGRLAHEKGAIGTGDMTTEAAAVKLMYLLGSKRSPAEAAGALKRAIAGEISVKYS